MPLFAPTHLHTMEEGVTAATASPVVMLWRLPMWPQMQSPGSAALTTASLSQGVRHSTGHSRAGRRGNECTRARLRAFLRPSCASRSQCRCVPLAVHVPECAQVASQAAADDDICHASAAYAQACAYAATGPREDAAARRRASAILSLPPEVAAVADVADAGHALLQLGG